MRVPKITGLPILFYRIRYEAGVLFVVTQCGFVSWIFPAAPTCLTVYVNIQLILEPYPLMHEETKTQLVRELILRAQNTTFGGVYHPRMGMSGHAHILPMPTSLAIAGVLFYGMPALRFPVQRGRVPLKTA
jgi:hypothetical protein